MQVNPLAVASAASALGAAADGSAVRQIEVLQKQLQALNRRYVTAVQNDDGRNPVAEQEMLLDVHRQMRAMEQQIEELKRASVRTPTKEPASNPSNTQTLARGDTTLQSKLGSKVDTQA